MVGDNWHAFCFASVPKVVDPHEVDTDADLLSLPSSFSVSVLLRCIASDTFSKSHATSHNVGERNDGARLDGATLLSMASLMVATFEASKIDVGKHPADTMRETEYNSQ